MIMEGSQDNAMRITEYWKDIHEQNTTQEHSLKVKDAKSPKETIKADVRR